MNAPLSRVPDFPDGWHVDTRSHSEPEYEGDARLRRALRAEDRLRRELEGRRG